MGGGAAEEGRGTGSPLLLSGSLSPVAGPGGDSGKEPCMTSALIFTVTEAAAVQPVASSPQHTSSPHLSPHVVVDEATCATLTPTAENLHTSTGTTTAAAPALQEGRSSSSDGSTTTVTAY